ncbi:DinB family protein [Pedobacter sp. SYSU D00535]|uniref:DinB family protein n=1 Tax=Pedobacter sp. SYSU D00535 TaxID=2810308 RepID=UPI001A9605FC|nr:DinB family protein [Pedobacter sp. SYSU D00535]
MVKELINYTRIADRAILDTFLQTELSLPEAECLFGHILNAQHVWLARINGQQPRYEPFSPQQKSDFESLHLENSEGLIQMMNQDLSREVEYRNTKGEAFFNTVEDMLIQALNHSTYHRGQIATQFRLNGLVPPTTDYIFFKRTGLL